MGEHMQLKQTRNELCAARHAVAAMRAATSRETYFQAWQDCLQRLERTWIKAERECEPFRTQFQRWQSAFKKSRAEDELLRYLIHARHVDQHGIHWTAAYSSGGVRLSIPPGKTVEINLTTEPTKLTGLEMVEQIPLGFVLVPIRNRGKDYNPPRMHCGQPIEGSDPLVVAEAGLKFYEGLIMQLSNAFRDELDALPSPHPDSFPRDGTK